MKKRVVVFGLIVLIAGLAVYTTSALQRIEVPYEVEVPYSDVEDKEQLLDEVKDPFWIKKGEHASWSYNLIQGRTLNITWQAEDRVYVYVMTESQYNTFTQKSVTECITLNSAQSGFLLCPLPFNDTFHIVIYYNPEQDIDSVEIIYYESTLMWQEEVTRYRSETRYREELNYLGLGVGSAISMTGCVIAALGWRSGSRRRKSSRVP